MTTPRKPNDTQREAVRKHCAAARRACSSLITDGHCRMWLQVLADLSTAVKRDEIPGVENIMIQEHVVSFLDSARKRRYYEAQSTPADDAAQNTTVGTAGQRMRSGQWNLLLSCSEIGIRGQQNNWHCVGVARLDENWNIYTSQSNAAAGRDEIRRNELRQHNTILALIRQRRPAAFKPPCTVQLRQPDPSSGHADCVRFSLMCLIDFVENYLLGQAEPEKGGKLSELMSVSVRS